MTLRHWSFDSLPPEISRLIRGWFERAWAARDVPDDETFEQFIYCWIAFNAWAASVTGADQDRQIVGHLAAEASLGRRFDELMYSDAEFQQAARAFQQWWPIFSAKALRSERLENDADADVQHRKSRVQRIVSKRPQIRRTPRDDQDEFACADQLELTWANTLTAAYQVRCNLFHGGKSVYCESDAALVASAFRVLVRFFNSVLRKEP